MRCWECPDEVRYNRGCSLGYRQGLGYEARPPLETTCPVLLTEPVGFSSAHRVGKWLERGSPALSMSDVTHSQLDLAEFVAYEVAEGQRNYDERRERSNRRLAELAAKVQK